MKYIEEGPLGIPTVELTERNLRTLLKKLTDPNSKRTIIDGTSSVAVTAVSDEEHYAERAPGIMYTNGEAH